jgi:protein-L-isoaspartate(D-aspartate) O-methyltransferase
VAFFALKERDVDHQQELAIIRRAFAKHVLASARVADTRLEAAFAAVPRERFLNPGPWPIIRYGGYVLTPDADPVYVYDDVLIGIVPERSLNNGMPSYHAPVLASAAIGEGEHVVHVGAGTGYYTAIMAHLVGSSGRVTAIEYEPSVAARARDNLASHHNVTVVQGDGTAVNFEPADVIYVNAGATHPAERWLNGLTEGGRLLLPLTGVKNTAGNVRHGRVFLIERKGKDYFVQPVTAVAVYPCEGGGRNPDAEAALAAAIERDNADRAEGWRRVTRLYREPEVPEERCWLRAPGWALAYE